MGTAEYRPRLPELTLVGGSDVVSSHCASSSVAESPNE